MPRISEEMDIPSSTIYTWIRNKAKKENLQTSGNTNKHSSKWSSEDKIYIVLESYTLTAEELESYFSKGGTILAVGRAVRTLLKHNIYPDYIIITDPSEKLYSMQLEGLDIDVPIIVLSTCDKNVMNKYKGRKYIALQRGFDKAEKYAKDKKVNLVETGGSVATTALDIAIKMKSNPIVFVSQDLAYTENKTHSKETFSKNTVDSNSLREVQDINGNIVKTSKNLYIYLRWIQNRIEKEDNIDFIDATEGGARIKGTKVMKLSKIIDKIHLNFC